MKNSTFDVGEPNGTPSQITGPVSVLPFMIFEVTEYEVGSEVGDGIGVGVEGPGIGVEVGMEVGNGVPFLAAKGLATTINEFLSDNFCSNSSTAINPSYHFQTPHLEKQLSLLDLTR